MDTGRLLLAQRGRAVSIPGLAVRPESKLCTEESTHAICPAGLPGRDHEHRHRGRDARRPEGVHRRAGPRLVVSTRLRPTASATTVRIRDGGLVVADGPFAEAKEQIGGFFIV